MSCEDMEKESKKETSKLELVGNFVSRHFLPLGTICIVPLGIFLPQPAVFLNKKISIIKICIVTLFTAVGVKFRVAEVKSAFLSYKEIIIGLIVILLATPFMGVSLLKLPQFGTFVDLEYQLQMNISGNISFLSVFGPEEFRIGLQLFCLSPCASAFPTIVVTAANGNRAITLLVAILCTIISIFTMPVMISFLIPAAQNISFDILSLVLKIMLFILLPLLVGRLLRFIPFVKTMVVKLGKRLKYVTSGALLVIFWVKVSQASAKGDLEKFSPLSITAVTVLGTAVISTYILVPFVILSFLRLPKKSTLAIAILAAARNSSVTITIIDNLPDSMGDKDLIFLPIVFVYLAMVIIINMFGYFMTIKDEIMDDNVTGIVQNRVDTIHGYTSKVHNKLAIECEDAMVLADSYVSTDKPNKDGNNVTVMADNCPAHTNKLCKGFVMHIDSTVSKKDHNNNPSNREGAVFVKICEDSMLHREKENAINPDMAAGIPIGLKLDALCVKKAVCKEYVTVPYRYYALSSTELPLQGRSTKV